ncbi:hypothetical protein OQA88_11392 [Cercophora sp. LCS_1]
MSNYREKGQEMQADCEGICCRTLPHSQFSDSQKKSRQWKCIDCVKEMKAMGAINQAQIDNETIINGIRTITGLARVKYETPIPQLLQYYQVFLNNWIDNKKVKPIPDHLKPPHTVTHFVDIVPSHDFDAGMKKVDDKHNPWVNVNPVGDIKSPWDLENPRFGADIKNPAIEAKLRAAVKTARPLPVFGNLPTKAAQGSIDGASAMIFDYDDPDCWNKGPVSLPSITAMAMPEDLPAAKPVRTSGRRNKRRGPTKPWTPPHTPRPERPVAAALAMRAPIPAMPPTPPATPPLASAAPVTPVREAVLASPGDFRAALGSSSPATARTPGPAFNAGKYGGRGAGSGGSGGKRSDVWGKDNNRNHVPGLPSRQRT